MKKNLLCFISMAVILYSCESGKKVASSSATREAPSTTGNAQSLVRITSDPVPEFYPKVSPDGKKIVFQVRDDTKKVTAPSSFGVDNRRTSSGTNNLYEGGSHNTNVFRIWSIMLINIGQPGRTPLVGEYTQCPSFFPDSKEIIYCYLKPAFPVIARSQIDGLAGIRYVSPNNMGEFDSNPVVSSDGKMIAFTTRMSNSSQICTMDINGMNVTILTEGYKPSWSPKNKLVYSKNVGKYQQIFIYDLITGQSTQLTQGEFNNTDPYFSLDGKYIAFGSTRDNENEQIFVMKENGSDMVQITQGSTRNGMPCFGPDNTIYFCSNAASGKKGSIDKYLWTTADIWSVKPILR